MYDLEQWVTMVMSVTHPSQKKAWVSHRLAHDYMVYEIGYRPRHFLFLLHDIWLNCNLVTTDSTLSGVGLHFLFYGEIQGGCGLYRPQLVYLVLLNIHQSASNSRSSLKVLSLRCYYIYIDKTGTFLKSNRLDDQYHFSLALRASTGRITTN